MLQKYNIKARAEIQAVGFNCTLRNGCDPCLKMPASVFVVSGTRIRPPTDPVVISSQVLHFMGVRSQPNYVILEHLGKLCTVTGDYRTVLKTFELDVSMCLKSGLFLHMVK